MQENKFNHVYGNIVNHFESFYCIIYIYMSIKIQSFLWIVSKKDPIHLKIFRVTFNGSRCTEGSRQCYQYDGL